ncbi:MAG: hypothetical protein M1839_001059 [Geoglossum umbratile]|nr:MAG: hypothetical protein M1839_001059 [Geoglossum umbratile]
MPDRSERPVKRQRQLSTDYDDSSGSDDWIPGAKKDKDRADRKERERDKAKDRDRDNSTMPRAPSSRRRANQNQHPTSSPLPSITVARPPAVSDDKKSIRLTVKMPSQKLREATSGVAKSISVNSRDRLDVSQIVTGPRGSRAKKPIVDASESEEDEEEEEEEEEEEADEEEEEEEEDEDEDEDEADEDEDGDAEGESEDVDADGDIDMDDPQMQPASFVKIATPMIKPVVKVTPAAPMNAKSIQAKQMEEDDDDDDDDELSELESEEDEDATGVEADEDIEVEDDGGEGEDEDDDDDDSDSGTTPATGSRASTPDLSRLTQRQRSRLDQVLSGELLELPAGIGTSIPSLKHKYTDGFYLYCHLLLDLYLPSGQHATDNVYLILERSTAKKALTADEQAMRRAEMARRRKNLSEKRNEEEKVMFSCTPNLPKLHVFNNQPINSILSSCHPPVRSTTIQLGLTPMPLTGTKQQMDTINRLLKKQAPKRRGRAGNPTADTTTNNSGGDATPANGEVGDVVTHEKPNRVFVRWVSNAQGSRLGIPEEWLGESVGRMFGGRGGSRMVEEVN